jgi:hypothetical protein
MRWTFTFALAVLGSVGGAAQEEKPAIPLAAVKSLRCTFQSQSVGAWRRDGTAQVTERAASLVLRFVSIDMETGTAQLMSGQAGADVTVRAAEGYVHFMQSFRTGPLYVTSVFAATPRAGRFKAVHSRHELFAVPLPGATSSPEQYYGECEVRP